MLDFLGSPPRPGQECPGRARPLGLCRPGARPGLRPTKICAKTLTVTTLGGLVLGFSKSPPGFVTVVGERVLDFSGSPPGPGQERPGQARPLGLCRPGARPGLRPTKICAKTLTVTTLGGLVLGFSKSPPGFVTVVGERVLDFSRSPPGPGQERPGRARPLGLCRPGARPLAARAPADKNL